MVKMLNESCGTVELDFEKYGLSHLRSANLTRWSDSDVEKIMDAFVAENIGPVLSGPLFTPDNMIGLLGTSYCRCCGKCCLPNPRDPKNRGVILCKEDLALMAKHSRYSYRYLTKRGLIHPDPNSPRRWHLPLPCMFYDQKNRRCTIYEIRPLVCRLFPMPRLIEVERQVGIPLSVGCEYGKDIFRNLISLAKRFSSPI